MQSGARRVLDKPDFERMNLPEEFWRVKVQGVPEAVQQTVLRYLFRIEEMMDKGIGLLLIGEPGVGKTAIAALAAKEARARGYTVYFTGIWELRESVRSRISFEEETSIMDRCREVGLLVLDGLRLEDASELFVNDRTLEELVSFRRAAKRATIITTQMDMATIRSKMSKLSDALVGALVTIPVTGQNQRVRHHEEIVKEVFGDAVK